MKDQKPSITKVRLGLRVFGSRIGVFGSRGAFSSRVGVFGSRGVFGSQVGFWFPRGGVAAPAARTAGTATASTAVSTDKSETTCCRTKQYCCSWGPNDSEAEESNLVGSDLAAQS